MEREREQALIEAAVRTRHPVTTGPPVPFDPLTPEQHAKLADLDAFRETHPTLPLDEMDRLTSAQRNDRIAALETALDELMRTQGTKVATDVYVWTIEKDEKATYAVSRSSLAGSTYMGLRLEYAALEERAYNEMVERSVSHEMRRKEE